MSTKTEQSHDFPYTSVLFMLTRASRELPELREILPETKIHQDVVREQILEFVAAIKYINDTPLEEIPPGLKNIHILKTAMINQGRLLPMPFGGGARSNPQGVELFQAILDKAAHEKEHYSFWQKSARWEDKLAGVLEDGYGLGLALEGFVPDSDVGTNSVCEALAVIHQDQQYQYGANPETSLFMASQRMGWYNPDWGYNNEEMLRRGLWTSSD